MSNLLPVHAAEHIQRGLTEYLTTSFSLADDITAGRLAEFLTDPESGMFHGPYIRTRLPYAPATTQGKPFEWLPDWFEPYLHQAEAFERLTSISNGTPRRPDPTLVVTGTGSGKTESFLYPILDHCRRRPGPGIKALLLYPMNALANDQASRLARLISDNPALGGVTAGIYTGEQADKSSRSVTGDSLITDRDHMRSNPPDILLTNYKMLDQMLIREADRDMWAASATSLQYLVLDEFHTYDGAQGTDVALLLRRLGLMLRRNQPEGFLEQFPGAADRPLGVVTPVSTSATLGNEGQATDMLEFAHTIFGEQLDASAVITETKQTITQWQNSISQLLGHPEQPASTMPTATDVQAINAAIAAMEGQPGSHEDHVHEVFCREVYRCSEEIDEAVTAYAVHPLTEFILTHATQAIALSDMRPGDSTSLVQHLDDQEIRRLPHHGAAEFLTHALTEMTHLRNRFADIHGEWEGKKLPGVETHLWIRELSRIDRVVSSTAIEQVFRWSDNGPRDSTDDSQAWLPACYCRHCGRSGWMTSFDPGGETPETNLQTIRRGSLTAPKRQRPLLDASFELRASGDGIDHTTDGDSRVMWLDMGLPALSPTAPTEESLETGVVVPVLTYAEDAAEDLARSETCPSCSAPDAIRYLGSSVATLLSVALSNLFGLDGLSDTEKKTLVFTDSVQDAAHRAGFVQSRARTFALRTLIRQAVGNSTTTLAALPTRLITAAEGDARARYELLTPELTKNSDYSPYWSPGADPAQRRRAAGNVEKRLALDVALEFGDRADLARSLVSTGSLTSGVDVDDAVLRAAAEAALAGVALPLGDLELLPWARGVVETIRIRGGISHPWFGSYLRDDCNAYHLNKRASQTKGLPTFPKGAAPSFPRAGSVLRRADDTIDYAMPTASPRGVYARWTAKVLGTTTHDAATAVTALMKELARRDVLGTVDTSTSATIFHLRPESILVTAEDQPETLECQVCRSRLGVPEHVRTCLESTPCLNLGCLGSYAVVGIEDNYYRSLYSVANTRTVVAHEHTSLLDKADRLRVENQFKASSEEPDAPNVLVATPTLEMGIDIGDLSTVMLASLPKTVASYVQRVGRAGRLTGNSLVIALIRGRGMALPALEKPLSVIAGAVAAPAAFLSAQEILHRQFTAFLLDGLRLTEHMQAPKNAADVFLDSPTRRTVTDVLLERLREGVDDTVTQFCNTLQGFTDQQVLDELRQWATGQGPTSLAGELVNAQQRWNALEKELLAKESVLEQRDLVLSARKDAPGVDEDTIAQARTTSAALRFIRKQLSDSVKGEYWISALERYGLLPNFTLLDDSVALELSVSQMNSSTFEFDTYRVDYARGISSALYELAPGATFYAQGIAATIDSVELGADGSNVEKWRMCPSCSYSRTESVAGDSPKVNPGACPECGDATFADLSQLIDVVPMKKVFAEVEKTRSAINDHRDERSSVRFQTALSAVVPEGGDGGSWYLTGSGFGVQYLPRVLMRWLNLGKGTGDKRMFASRETEAPLFRVCSHCGHVDSEAGSNHWRDHRPWCRLRNADEEETITFALGRSLSTQGVRLFLPQLLTVADTVTVPSIIAAIRLGFKEVFGGDPSHLDVATVRLGTGEDSSDALLLHDQVPGGTGYLSQFARADKVRNLLEKAYLRVRHCICVGDDRACCPSCLLPYAQPGAEESTSRAAAEAALAKILGDNLHPEDGADPLAVEWEGRITHAQPANNERSQLETLFLHLLRDSLQARNVPLTKQVRNGRNEWVFAFPQSHHQWRMREQVDFGYTRPDFYFSTDDPDIRDIAVYLDGASYHISATHERVHGDMDKRTRLYRENILPWSMSWTDLQDHRDAPHHALPVPPVWFNTGLQGELAAQLNLEKSLQELLLRDPLSQMLAILSSPDPEQWRRFGTAAFLHSVVYKPGNRATFAGDIDVSNSEGKFTLLLRSRVGAVDKRAWNLFLSMSNLFFLEPTRADIRTSTIEAAPELATPVPADPMDSQPPSSPQADHGTGEAVGNAAEETSISTGWNDIIAEFEGESEVQAALRALARNHVRLPDEVGAEISSEMTIVSWTDINMVVVYPGDGDQLRKHNWTAVDLEQVTETTLPDSFDAIKEGV